jgi:hypothetical protein
MTESKAGGGASTTAQMPVRDIGFKRPQKKGIAALLTRPEAGAVLGRIRRTSLRRCSQRST